MPILWALLLICAPAGFAQTIFDWKSDAPDANWTQGASGARWFGGIPGTNYFDNPPFGVLRFNNNHQTLMTNNVGGTYGMHGIIFGSSATAVRTLTGNPMQLFDFGDADPYIQNDSTNTHVISLNLTGDGTAADPLQIRLNSSGGITFNGTINNNGSWIDITGTTTSNNSPTVTFNGVISGSAGINKLNANTVAIFAATNTYTNLTQVSAGRLIITNGGGIAAASAVQISNGARLVVNRVTNAVFSNAAIANIVLSNTISGQGGVQKGGATGHLTLAASNSYTGGTFMVGGNLISGTNGSFGLGVLSYAEQNTTARLYLNGTTNTVTGITFGSSTQNQVIANEAASTVGRLIIDQSSGSANALTNTFIRDGAGTLTLTKNGAGTLNLFNLGTNGGTYSGGLTVNAGTVRVSTNAVYALGSGGITLAGGTLEYATNVATTVTNAVSLSDSTTSTFTNIAGGVFTFGTNITGSGTLAKTGAGTLQLGGVNTFNGLNVNEGTVLASGAANILNGVTNITLGGGTLHLRRDGGTNTLNGPSITVSSASTLVWQNTNTTTNGVLNINSPGLLALNANLTVSNISTPSSMVNQINWQRSMTGSGDLIVSTYNNISSSADNYSTGRVQLSVDQSGWNGNLVVARGTANWNTTNTGSGGIVLGTTADAFGAGMQFNLGNANSASPHIISNAVTVRSGGFRSIKLSAGQDFSVTLTKNVNLEGSLNLDSSSSANQSLTLSGNISGVGGVDVTRSTGTQSRVVLSGSNNYTGATTVTSGRLELNSTTGSAAGGTTSVSVASGATLLISQSEQVNNSAAVTLSGGTIQRGSGVTEQMGALDLTTASTINFGTGTAGTLRFGIYEGNATPDFKLTVSNFALGNKLVFGNDISSWFTTASYTGTSFTSTWLDISGMEASAFGGFTAGWDSGTSSFTITSVPEPSTVLAALGLSGLMLWGPVRRRFGRPRQ